ncbi:MAG TPA: OmpH family outer membrane protein [Candidatus Binatia bacterium]|nr:OmpH family outer membrane protein [Candidatus Binatia bacterium]
MKTSAHAFLLAAALSLASVPASGQAAPAAAPNPNSRVAIVDIRVAMQSTAEGKQLGAELQSQFAVKQADLDNMRKSLEDIQNQLRTRQQTLSDEERARLERQGERIQRQLQRKQEEYQQDANDAQQDAFDKLGRKMAEVVSRYARDNNFGVVMDASQACQVYCSNQLDITQEIIKLYDQAYPVKGGATPAGKPGTTPTRPATSTNPSSKPPAPTKP